jgi:hypothetical protein
MPRFARIAALAALIAFALTEGPALAGDGGYLTWPGKSDAPAYVADPAPLPVTRSQPPARGLVGLSQRFFGSRNDMAAPPGPLPPRAVNGSQAATAAGNSATNRARQNELLTADTAADGPTGGAGSTD